MASQPLMTLKEVAERIAQPPHRVIHLCEKGLIRPAVDAVGRGKVRQFDRDNVARIILALNLQDAGVQIPLIKPVMEELDRIMEIPAFRDLRKLEERFDLVAVINLYGNENNPFLLWLTPPDQVAFVVSREILSEYRSLGLDLHTSPTPLLWRGVSIVVNLTAIADQI